MMFSFPVPVVSAPMIGPGSQPLDDEQPLNTLSLPSDMHTFRPPIVELDSPPEVVAAAIAFLRHVLAEMESTPYAAAEPLRFDLAHLEPAVRAEINDLFGEGEVAVLTDGELRAQETAFTGMWRVFGEGHDLLEVVPFPIPIRERALARRMPAHALVPPDDAAGLMNALPLVHEILQRAAACKPGDAAYVINLSLLPVTPEDTAWMDEVLGRGGVSVLSRGFGNCRITATALPHVWWVQYFNNMDKLILNSIEIVDLPAVALAAAEDYEETLTRFAEWIESLEAAR